MKRPNDAADASDLTLADLVAALSLSPLSAGRAEVTVEQIRTAIVAAVLAHGIEHVQDTAARQALNRARDDRLTWCRIQVSKLVAALTRVERAS